MTEHSHGFTKDVLAVDDHPVNLRLIMRQIQSLNYSVDAVASGEQALALLAKGRYQLILTDCHMSGMDGFELARQLRMLEKAPAPQTPIFLCTADETLDEAAVRGVAINGVMLKPIDRPRLLELLRRWCIRPSSPPSEGEAP